MLGRLLEFTQLLIADAQVQTGVEVERLEFDGVQVGLNRLVHPVHEVVNLGELECFLEREGVDPNRFDEALGRPGELTEPLVDHAHA